jgi:hypothetical protein
MLAAVVTFAFRLGLWHGKDTKDVFPLFCLVWLAAVLGSAVNITTQANPGVIPGGIGGRIIYALWKLLVAMTFATFLYAIFISKIIAGGMFPNFQGAEDTPYSFAVKFLQDCKPKTNQDVAKMLVWAFVVGYLEKFVPNIISRIQTAKSDSLGDPD